jgi:hypothetical protein
MVDELLGMSGSNMQMDSQAFPSENDTNFFVSDVSQIQETLFDKSC